MKPSYFKDLDLHLPQLESIDLSNSGWLSNHSLQAIGKSDKLKRVILRGCKRIGEVFVYTALATRFGFQNTTYIDLRDTFGNLDLFYCLSYKAYKFTYIMYFSVGDSEVTCFGRLPKVTHLYFGRTSNVQMAAPSQSESNGRITDRGVLSMCLGPIDANDSGKILNLCLANTDVTDDCLSKLAAAFPLKVLDVRGTQITGLGIESFTQKRPACEVIHDGI